MFSIPEFLSLSIRLPRRNQMKAGGYPVVCPFCDGILADDG
jgi:hypothetical protein